MWYWSPAPVPALAPSRQGFGGPREPSALPTQAVSTRFGTKELLLESFPTGLRSQTGSWPEAPISIRVAPPLPYKYDLGNKFARVIGSLPLQFSLFAENGGCWKQRGARKGRPPRMEPATRKGKASSTLLTGPPISLFRRCDVPLSLLRGMVGAGCRARAPLPLAEFDSPDKSRGAGESESDRGFGGRGRRNGHRKGPIGSGGSSSPLHPSFALVTGLV